jgi:hypothetical protein
MRAKGPQLLKFWIESALNNFSVKCEIKVSPMIVKDVHGRALPHQDYWPGRVSPDCRWRSKYPSRKSSAALLGTGFTSIESPKPISTSFLAR